VLLGGFAPATAANPRPYSMPPFAQQLNDEDVAAVVGYIRQSWSNKASAVNPAEVSRSRHTPVD
jgi:mono/diheme cytochrome c family protein